MTFQDLYNKRYIQTTKRENGLYLACYGGTQILTEVKEDGNVYLSPEDISVFGKRYQVSIPSRNMAGYYLGRDNAIYSPSAWLLIDGDIQRIAVKEDLDTKLSKLTIGSKCEITYKGPNQWEVHSNEKDLCGWVCIPYYTMKGGWYFEKLLTKGFGG